MRTCFFVTHPDVAVDPQVPVPQWGLSERGRARMETFARRAELARVRHVWSSAETKAVEAAAILARCLALVPRIDEGLHENDRSSTGFLPPPEFEAVADAFFAQPEASIRGWERAADAQARVDAAVGRVLAASAEGDVAILAHGGVGTLLLCKLLGEPIDRRHDQPFQGHVFRFVIGSGAVLSTWEPIAPR